MKKLNLGCGSDIKEKWVNHDIVQLDGVDVVHDLKILPWPWKDQEFEEIYMKDVLEHLPDTIKTMEELHRITKPGAKIFIAVPYWNSWEAITDPTHVKQFNEMTFNFFDPKEDSCKYRPYYTKARFSIEKVGYVICPFGPHIIIPHFSRAHVIYNKILKMVLHNLASYFSNVIIGLDVYLERL